MVDHQPVLCQNQPSYQAQIMHDSSLDLFCQKAEEQANDFALTIEALAAALEVTVDYYLEEFHEVR